MKYPETVRIIHGENGGQSTAHNEGIKLAGDEWICFVDADGYLVWQLIDAIDCIVRCCCMYDRKANRIVLFGQTQPVLERAASDLKRHLSSE